VHTNEATTRRRKRILVVVAVAITATAAGLTGAYAAGGFTDASGHINACVEKTLGVVRVVQPGTACKPTETPLAWNQQGPAGPAGGAGQKLVSYSDATSYDEPTNRVETADNTGPIAIASGPSFTLTAPAFVQVMGYGRMTSGDEHGGYGSCNGGYPAAMGPYLYLRVDGQLEGFSTNGLNPGPGIEGRTETVTLRLGAGTHTLTWHFLPDDCSASPTGTTHVDQLSATVVAYL
jgi:hypothetical protein